jgi:hypothetical protein
MFVSFVPVFKSQMHNEQNTGECHNEEAYDGQIILHE